MQSPRQQMMASHLIEKQVKMLSDPDDLVISEETLKSIAATGIKAHLVDLDVLQQYPYPIKPLNSPENSFYKEIISKVRRQSFMDHIFDFDVSVTYPKSCTFIKDPASLFCAGIGRNHLSTVEQMKAMRTALRNQMDLDKFDEEMLKLLGDDLEGYMNVRDRVQVINEVFVLIAMNYKSKRRLTKEIMVNTYLIDLEGININEFLGLTVEKAIEKIERIIESEAHILSGYMEKYPGITEIRQKFKDTVTLSPMQFSSLILGEKSDHDLTELTPKRLGTTCPACAANAHWNLTFSAPHTSIFCTPDMLVHTCKK